MKNIFLVIMAFMPQLYLAADEQSVDKSSFEPIIMGRIEQIIQRSDSNTAAALYGSAAPSSKPYIEQANRAFSDLKNVGDIEQNNPAPPELGDDHDRCMAILFGEDDFVCKTTVSGDSQHTKTTTTALELLMRQRGHLNLTTLVNHDDAE